MSGLPTGTVTFLFTDIEGSTRLLERMGDDARQVFDRHDSLVREAIETHGGVVVRTEGDSFFAAFTSATDALSSAVDAQSRLQGELGDVLWVRMGIHTGEGVLGGGDYHGLDVHRAARISAAANGGQIVLSSTSAALVRLGLPAEVSLRDLGHHHLKDLSTAEHIFETVVSGLRDEFPPLRSLDAIPNNLPTQLTSFIGREDVVAAISDLLRSHRLLTLTGPGGTGKSRLGLQVAAQNAHRYQGVYFVALAPIMDVNLVLPTVVSTLGLTLTQGDPLHRLTEHIGEKRWLIILDNFEQVLGAGPDIAKLLAYCPQLTVFVTSRAPLRVSGEQEFPVPPLPLPHHEQHPEELSHVESVALFTDRATAARPDFTLDSETAPAVISIVRRLDGLPLAIELAAARVKLLSVQVIAERIADRLDLLAGGGRDRPERQQTLRAAINWSYDLLDRGARRLMARMAVFRGGASLEAIEAICTSPYLLEDLFTLVDHSLVRQSEVDGETRFSMLETIRQFAEEQLLESDDERAVRDNHLRFFRSVAEEARDHLTRVDRGAWLARLDRELDNLRGALSWAVKSESAEEGNLLAGALWRYWHMRGPLFEGRKHTLGILELPGASAQARLRGLEAAGGIAYWQADQAEAGHYYMKALEAARDLGDPVEIAGATYNAAFPLIFSGEDVNAELFLREAGELYASLSDAEGTANVLWGMGDIYWLREDTETAVAYFKQALIEYASSDNIFMRGWSHRMICAALLKLGNLDEARQHAKAGMEIFATVGDISGILGHLRDFTELAVLAGQADRALVLFGATSAAQERSGVELLSSGPNEVAGIRELLDSMDDRGSELVDKGRELSLEQAIDFALSDQV